MEILKWIEELENLMIEIEVAAEKAHTITYKLSEDYFTRTEKYAILGNHNAAGIMNNITTDYVWETWEGIKEAKKIINGIKDTGIEKALE